jgi:hypothetical protein
MYVQRVPNRNSPPAILLRESYREADKIKKRTLGNLSIWSERRIEALRRVLRDEPSSSAHEGLVLLRSLPHGILRPRWGSHVKSASSECCLKGGASLGAPRCCASQ